MALIPAEHRGRSSSPVAGRGLFLVVALVLIETSDVTKTGLTGRLNGAAVTEQLSSASHTPFLSTVVTPRAPLFSHSWHLSCCINFFHLLVTMLRVSLMCQSLMCMSTFMSKRSLKSSHCSRKRYIITFFYIFFKDEPK